jgi:hypothetical protein
VYSKTTTKTKEGKSDERINMVSRGIPQPPPPGMGESAMRQIAKCKPITSGKTAAQLHIEAVNAAKTLIRGQSAAT